VLVSNRDGADATASAASSKTEVVADASKAQPDDAKADAPKPEEPKPESGPDEAKADDGAAEAKADDGGEAPPEEPTTNTDAKTEAVQDSAATRPGLASATVKPSAKLPMLARPPAVPPPPRTRVEAALRAREIRALDILLVVRKPSRPLAFGEAVRHCSGLDVQGIQGWRLPDVGELASLDEAGMLTRGFYWSQTSGDTFGDTHMAWNGRTRQAASRIKGSVALCVRGDRGEAQ
jgi:hypothetical protein